MFIWLFKDKTWKKYSSISEFSVSHCKSFFYEKVFTIQNTEEMRVVRDKKHVNSSWILYSEWGKNNIKPCEGSVKDEDRNIKCVGGTAGLTFYRTILIISF